jgi:hypothetical protein
MTTPYSFVVAMKRRRSPWPITNDRQHARGDVDRRWPTEETGALGADATATETFE